MPGDSRVHGAQVDFANIKPQLKQRSAAVIIFLELFRGYQKESYRRYNSSDVREIM